MATKEKQPKLMTPEFRVSYPYVFEPYQNEDGGAPKFKITMLFPKGTDLSKMMASAKAAADAKWPKKKPKGLRNPFRDGDDEKPDTDGYTNMTFVTASSKYRPQVVDENVTPLVDGNDFYPGCWARATVTAFAYDVAGNKGVSFALSNVQKLRDDASFGNRTNAADDFDAIEGETETVAAASSGNASEMFDA